MLNTRNVRRVVDAIVDAVAIQLAPSGWRHRALGRPLGVETFTRDVGGGVLATMDLFPPLLSIGTPWPQELGIDIGAGLEPALDLMPLLTLLPRPTLVRDPAVGRYTAEVTIAGDRADQRAEAVREIVTDHAPRATAFAGNFDAVAILTAVRRTADADGGEWWHQRYLATLVALGRHDEVREALGTYEPRFGGEPDADRIRRFARQVRRRVTEPPTTVPPVEETLAVLPPPRRLRDVPKPDFRGAWQRDRAGRAATKAVEARADGRSLAELRDMLAAEYATRGIPISPIGVAVLAEHIAAVRRPFGRIEVGLRMAATVTTAVVQLTQVFSRQGSMREPDWLTPPDRAAYVIEASDDQVVAVRIDDDVDEYLDRALAEGRHVDSLGHVPVWLTTPDALDGTVRVHLGARPIGIVAATDAASFASAFRAAALFDEDVTTQARTYRTLDGVHLVELPAGTVWSVDPVDQPDIDDDDSEDVDV
jgi:hypothetical protein